MGRSLAQTRQGGGFAKQQCHELSTQLGMWLPGNTAGTGPPAGNNNLILDSPKEGWAFLFLTRRAIPESRREF